MPPAQQRLALIGSEVLHKQVLNNKHCTAHFERLGHRITGDRRLGCSRGGIHEKTHMAIDDATRLACDEILPDEMQATTVGFLLQIVAWFDSQGISCGRVLSNNGSAYSSKPWREYCSALCLIPKRTSQYPHARTANRSGSSRPC